ncbi:polar amino acid ABC transporter, inner membrane subunit [Methylobacterium sp. 4-46]|uniref:ABC transporter permease n=1 Tax=unclassified Methylobacterium TaxID=2615210 RepID=UPI000165CD48|nr:MULTISPECIES: ABC transporter permease subunit [Methylobacterium]ACA18828.1 polar amino acid ABC transporter, inner membrane subunit [Methylobacterium sp. 4-46]WFT78054.1 ABC transporter permease subunit [Methylobacterium nodulans]
MIDLAFLQATLVALSRGLPLTLGLTAGSLACGAVLALLAAAARLSGIGPLSLLSRAYVFVFRGTPLLVQLFLIYYGLGQFRQDLQALNLWWFFREPYWCALFALSLNTGAYTAEIVRGGVLAVPHGALLAGRACGMSRLTLLSRVTLPLAARQALPAYGNEVILVVKSTALASTITIMEVTGIAQKLIAQSFRALEIFCCAAAFYLAAVSAIIALVRLAEARLAPDLRARPAALPRPA